ncbi:hypothetical protein GOP47_0017278 [Adiantum capillus-veneris]|uniref:Sperm-associated antigen 16 protein n=1 Tax=Adiantum capillus-veneris TaxID=13818 RepID=A0A9D4UFA4_ADICA|nr:hypothetical protein GOP47_0017278 [Adiantum capillus-veneris]
MELSRDELQADYTYEEEVQIPSDSEEDDAQSEDLDATIRSLQRLSFLLDKDKISKQTLVEDHKGISKKPEVIDDFFRNFLVRLGCTKTLNVFETEWFELKQSGKLLDSQLGDLPDEYTRSMHLEEVLQSLQQQLQQANYLAQCRQEMLEKLRKERNIHRMHHRRIAQEKNKLIVDVKRLQRHFSQYEPIIRELKKKYEAAVRQKALVVLERDKLQEQISTLAQYANSEEGSLSYFGSKSDGTEKDFRQGKVGRKEASEFTRERHSRLDPLSVKFGSTSAHHQQVHDPPLIKGFTMQKTFKGHAMPISNVAIHPKKPVVVTASDDATWKMWGLPDGDLIMTGDGHKEWVAGLDFHPRGMQLASSSGDCTVKVWSFEKARCMHTFADHTQAVWSVAYHDSGDVLASASLDHTARIWDLTSPKCRGTLRGHVDSVNCVKWKSGSSILCTASSDKTISLWDARTSLCIQTFYGHQTSCNHAIFNPKGSLVASVDAAGIVKLWDIRKISEFSTIDTGPSAANKCAFDESGNVLAIASSDNTIKCFQVNETVSSITELLGHEDAVQAIVFDPACKFMVSGSTDCTFRVWA